MCTRVAHSQSVVCPEERVEPAQVPYVKDPTKVMMTKNSRDAHVRVEQRTLTLYSMQRQVELTELKSVQREVLSMERRLVLSHLQHHTNILRRYLAIK